MKSVEQRRGTLDTSGKEQRVEKGKGPENFPKPDRVSALQEKQFYRYLTQDLRLGERKAETARRTIRH